ncbi:FtsX-like permease family protein [Pseudonocardia sp. NPDC046786]|uniref:FtsX-like permease family protein n=1 Tax=Pseudonocardia sp. NPDC046786 TaxID=3155471 RepID=UPI0033D9418D
MSLLNPATRAAVAGIRRRPRQLLLTGLAVLVATAFAAGAVLLTGTLRAALTEDAVHTPAGASHVVSVRSTDADADSAAGTLAQRLRAVPGVTDVAPGFSGVVPVAAGTTSGDWLVSSDPMTGPLSVLPAPEQGRPAGPGEVLVGAATAERTGLVPGDSVRLGGESMRVAGVVGLPFESLDSLVLTTQDALALDGTLYASRIDVAGDADTAALGAAAGGERVRTAAEQRDAEIAEASASVLAVLAGLSVFVGLALVASAVVVGSTFRIVLARRSRDLALLRCVGASRGQVTRSVLAEAALTGLVAGVFGTAAAVGAGHAGIAVARMSGVDAPALAVQPLWLAGCVLLAVLTTVLAALPPARAAGRVPPVVALGAADVTEARAPRARTRLPAAAVLAVLAAGTAGIGVTLGEQLAGLAVIALSGLLLFAALVVTGPFLISAAATLLRPVADRSGPLRLAVANASRLSRRTAAMTTVLALGVGLTAALLVAVAGASDDARASIDRAYPADAVILPVWQGDDAARGAAAQQLAVTLDAEPQLQAYAAGTEVRVDAVPGADPRAVREAVAGVIGDAGSVTWTADVREQMESGLSVARTIGAGLIGTTVVVAVVGVAVTLALSVGERTREIALLRTFGLTRAGSRRAVAAEAGLAGAVGAVVGVLLGAVYGLLALRAMGMDGGTPPVGQLVGLAAVVTVVSVAASVAPMRRAGRVEPAHGVVG